LTEHFGKNDAHSLLPTLQQKLLKHVSRNVHCSGDVEA